jgi:hypothetical protein
MREIRTSGSRRGEEVAIPSVAFSPTLPGRETRLRSGVDADIFVDYRDC